MRRPPRHLPLHGPTLNPLLAVLYSLRPAFTEPTFFRFAVLFAGWVRTTGPHAVSEALVQSGVSGKQHHASFHRFFAQARWTPDELGRRLLSQLAALSPGRLLVVIDDTLCTHKGPKVYGLGSHLDPVRSTRAVRLFAFGHVWVTLAVLVQVPLASRPWAVPILFRLYRTEAASKKAGHKHRKKTELAREMLDLIVQWFPAVQLEVSADLAYSNATLLRDLPRRVAFTGAMRDDAVLTRPRKRAGRSRAGRPLTADLPVPSPERIAASKLIRWKSISVRIYGRDQKLWVKELCARWYRAAGKRTLKIVIVKMTTGRLPYRVFFATDPSRSAQQVIEQYASRWAIEILFRDLKQLLGFGASRARTRGAVLRTTPWVGLNYTVLVLWFIRLRPTLPCLGLPARPWYRPKRHVSFADVLRLAQRDIGRVDWSDPRRAFSNFDPSPPLPHASERSG